MPNYSIPTEGVLIDWMTLRYPLTNLNAPGRLDVGEAIRDRFYSCLGMVYRLNAEGDTVFQKAVLDIEALRSDSVGVFWSIQGGADDQLFLVVGGSPASLEWGHNVFGSCNVQHAARVLVEAAGKELGMVLPPASMWSCRRLDVTANYALPDGGTVKQVLRSLLNSDSARRKGQSTAKGGDSVYWSPTSDLIKGKAYHKGPQMLHLIRQEKLQALPEYVELADRLLRLELTLGARWFRRLEDDKRSWWYLTREELSERFAQFFGPLVGGLEVTDMGRRELVKTIEDANGITENRAKAAFTTYRNIREDGYEETKAGMAERTWFLHLRYLRSAGIADRDLCAGNVIPFRSVRIVIANPVASWDDVRRAA